MKTYNMKNEFEKTFALFEQMKMEKIEPNDIIFLLIINACSQLGDLSICQSIFEQVTPTSLNNIWIQNALIDMWVSHQIISPIVLLTFITKGKSRLS
jgi:pentatricopeptide repeat protein